jgi:hypothetical protein
MTRHRIAKPKYLTVVSITNAVTVELWLTLTISLAIQTFCVTARPVHIFRHGLSFIFTAIAIHRGTGEAGHQTARPVLTP